MDKDFDKLCADIEENRTFSEYKENLFFPINLIVSGVTGAYIVECNQLCKRDGRVCWFYDEIDMMFTKSMCCGSRCSIAKKAIELTDAKYNVASYYYDIIKAAHEATEDLMGLTQKLIDEEVLNITPG